MVSAIPGRASGIDDLYLECLVVNMVKVLLTMCWKWRRSEFYHLVSCACVQWLPVYRMKVAGYESGYPLGRGQGLADGFATGFTQGVQLAQEVKCYHTLHPGNTHDAIG